MTSPLPSSSPKTPNNLGFLGLLGPGNTKSIPLSAISSRYLPRQIAPWSDGVGTQPNNPMSVIALSVSISDALKPGFEKKRADLLDASEVAISGNYSEVVLQSGGSDPKVVIVKA